MLRQTFGRGAVAASRKQRANVAALSKVACEVLENRRLFAFGLTTTSSLYTVDTGGGLVFSIIRGGTISSTVHLGDMTSAMFNGVETLAPYSATSRYSHYEQGLGSNAIISATVDPNGQWIMITCDDSNETSGAVIQYYIAKKGDADIYMASLPLDVNNGPGEGRYIAYMNRSVFTNIENPSDISQNVGAVEGSDVYYNADGTTHSKFYNDGRRMIDNTIHGISGTNIGAFMTMGNRETSSGGPFFKDIDFQTTSAATEMYNCLFTGHTQTEAYRQGLKGPYAMMFTTGATPALPDYSFMGSLGIQGWTPAATRGSLSGVASGMVSGDQTVVGLSNSTAQYWSYANASTGAYSIPGILPGTYTETIYDNELAVGTRTITIGTGQSVTANIANTTYAPAAIWTIGQWDGTPGGFLNDDKISIMHPSDVRMTPWTDVVYTIGTSVASDWPLVQFKAPSAANNPSNLPALNPDEQIVFNLTAAQAAQAMTLRIGITLAFEGGRPIISVNGGAYSAAPAASNQPDSRGITRGTWRGNNTTFTYGIAANAMHSGSNTIDIQIASGSYDIYSSYLQPSIVYDAVDLVPTASLTNAPQVTTITATPANQQVGVGGQITYSASAKDQFGNPIVANFDWSATRGTVNPNGTYTAPATTGGDTVTATSSGVSGSASISVLGALPTVQTPPTASPNPAFTLTSALSVLGADNNGESTLSYTWSVVGAHPSSVNFSINGTNAAKNTTATFGGYGTYNLMVTITDASGNTVTAPLTVVTRQYVVRYPADESSGAVLDDTSGGNNTASLTGSYSFVAGRTGNAVKLTGGYANAPAGVVSTLSDFTISTWVKIDTLSTWSRIFDFGTSTTTYMFLTPQAGTTNALRFAITTSGNTGEQQLNGPTIATGVWTNIVVTLAGSSATLYVNGKSVATNTSMTLHPSSLGSTGNNYLGKSQFSTDPAFLGSIDDFRIYGRALTAAEVNSLATTTAPPQVTGLTVVNSSGQVALGWTAASGATSYNVKRSLTSGGPYTVIATNLTGTTYTDTNVTNGTAYYYVVSAVNIVDEGPNSAEVVGLPSAAPYVVTAASATPNPVTANTTALSVLGGDDGGESSLTYSWSVVGSPPMPVSFSPNGPNAAKNATATFSAIGSYTLMVTITDASGLTATSTVNVTVNTIVGTAGNDTIRLIRSGANLVVYNNATSYSVAYASLGAINISSGAGTDSVNIDFSGGATPVPTAGLTVTGGGGADTLMITGTTGADSIGINANTITFSGSPITYAGVQSIIVNGNGGNDVLTQTAQPGNAATLVFNGNTSGGPLATDSLNISSGTFAFAAPAVNAGVVPISLTSLSIGAGASVSLATAQAQSDRWVLMLQSLNFNGNGSQLNLGGNDLILHNTAALTPAQALVNLNTAVQTGYGAMGTWTGPGISSAAAHSNAAHLTALGGAPVLAAGMFDGQNVVTTDVVVKYTYFGDSTADGKVDASDYSRIDNGYLNHLTGWFNGDFNYDGVINGSDYTLIDNAFNMQGAAIAASIAPAAAAKAAVISMVPISQTNQSQTNSADWFDDKSKKAKRLLSN